MTASSPVVFTRACMTWWTVPSPPAAMNRFVPRPTRSRMIWAQSISADKSTISTPALATAARNASTSAGGSFTPEERFRNSVAFFGNFRPAARRSTRGNPMKNLAFAALILQVLVRPLMAAEPTLSVGITGTHGADVPVLARVAEGDLATFAPARPQSLTVIVSYGVDTTTDALLDIEQHTKTIIEWAQKHGPLDGLGVSVSNANAELTAFAIKRLAVTAQGLNVANRIVIDKTENVGDAMAYFDAVVVNAADVEQTAAWLAERDPSKKIFAVVDITSPNPLFDLGTALAKGAARAYATSSVDIPSLAAFNRTMASDWAFDATAKTTVLDAKGAAVDMPVLSFVRGEDLRTLLIPRGQAGAASILSLPDDRFTKPRRLDGAGERDITDTGQRGGRLLVGTPVPKQPYAVLVDYRERPTKGVKETIDIATARGKIGRASWRESV